MSCLFCFLWNFLNLLVLDVSLWQTTANHVCVCVLGAWLQSGHSCTVARQEIRLSAPFWSFSDCILESVVSLSAQSPLTVREPRESGFFLISVCVRVCVCLCVGEEIDGSGAAEKKTQCFLIKRRWRSGRCGIRILHRDALKSVFTLKMCVCREMCSSQ